MKMKKKENLTRRFILDLEFVQALSNPYYLKFLAQHENAYFEQKEFVDYLKYLTYWQKPEYAKFITYPHCLFVLDQLQDEYFRKQLNNPHVIDTISTQQYYHWKFYKKSRMQTANPPPEPIKEEAPPTQ